MQRSGALAPLSRDHHHGLVIAQRLRRATTDTAAEARAGFLSFWSEDGARHFRIEEEILLPAFARRAAPDHEAVVRVLVEHVEIRRWAGDLATTSTPTLESLHELGERLQAHIRHEERGLFPLIEETLDEAELDELLIAIDRAVDATSHDPSRRLLRMVKAAPSLVAAPIAVAVDIARAAVESA